MKTIQQLLELSRNPHYQFTPEEATELNDFLSRQRVKVLRKPRKKKLSSSLKTDRVSVRNVVKKVDTYAPEAPEDAS